MVDGKIGSFSDVVLPFEVPFNFLFCFLGKLLFAGQLLIGRTEGRDIRGAADGLVDLVRGGS